MGVMRGTLPLGTTETERLGPYSAWIAALGEEMVSYVSKVVPQIDTLVKLYNHGEGPYI